MPGDLEHPDDAPRCVSRRLFSLYLLTSTKVQILTPEALLLRDLEHLEGATRCVARRLSHHYTSLICPPGRGAERDPPPLERDIPPHDYSSLPSLAHAAHASDTHPTQELLQRRRAEEV